DRGGSRAERLRQHPIRRMRSPALPGCFAFGSGARKDGTLSGPASYGTDTRTSGVTELENDMKNNLLVLTTLSMALTAGVAFAQSGDMTSGAAASGEAAATAETGGQTDGQAG